MAKSNQAQIAPTLRYRMPPATQESSNSTTPNEWFAERFPEQVQHYGPAFMEATWTDADGLSRIIPVHLNDDAFAAILGGDRSLGHHVIWCPQEETFYFFDYRVDAFCPTSEAKLKLLLSNFLVRCSQHCQPLVNISNLVVGFRDDNVLQGVVEKAKALLEVDRQFFQGKHGQRRYVGSRHIEPDEEPSYRAFVKQTVVKEPEGKVTLQDAFHRYYEFCRDQKMQPLTRQEFKGLVAEVIREQFNVGLRHDVPTATGKQGHGWFGVRLDDSVVFSRN